MRKLALHLSAPKKPVIHGRVLNCTLARSVHAKHEYYLANNSIKEMVDLEPEMIPCRDQGQEGSCTSFGHGANADWRQLQARRNEPGSNPGMIYHAEAFVPAACNFIYGQERLIDGDFSEDEGSFVHTGGRVATQIGHISERVYPYSEQTLYSLPTPIEMGWAATHKLSRACPVDLRDSRNIMSALSNRDPVIFGWIVHRSIRNVGNDGIIQMPGWFDRAVGGHCTTIFGYKMINNHLYFKIRNSWGTQWGANGYAWMPEHYINNPDLASDGWVVK